MKNWNITPAELSAALECPLSTIRAWHNRVGLLPRDEKGGWRRYSAEDAIAVNIVKSLTERGLAADAAVQIAHELHPQLKGILEEGIDTLVGISKDVLGDEYQCRVLNGEQPVWTEIGSISLEVMIILNLAPIALFLLTNVNKLRGLDPMTDLEFELEPIPGEESDEELS